ncbi:MAG: hypothetical protein AAGH19_00105 [Pseudomonadota bacterium]
MRRLKLTGYGWRYAVLITLFLGAQSYVLAHELEHEAEAHDEACTLCPMAAGIQHITVAPEPAVPVAPCAAHFSHSYTPVSTPVTQTFAEARAPPVYS